MLFGGKNVCDIEEHKVNIYLASWDLESANKRSAQEATIERQQEQSTVTSSLLRKYFVSDGPHVMEKASASRGETSERR